MSSGKRLISKLKYGIHPTDNIKPIPTGLGSRVFEPTPQQKKRCHEAEAYRGTVKY